jgi:hypothetical protein
LFLHLELSAAKQPLSDAKVLLQVQSVTFSSLLKLNPSAAFWQSAAAARSG